MEQPLGQVQSVCGHVTDALRYLRDAVRTQEDASRANAGSSEGEQQAVHFQHAHSQGVRAMHGRRDAHKKEGDAQSQSSSPERWEGPERAWWAPRGDYFP